MRFEKVVWTLLALFIVGSGLMVDPLATGADVEPRYESADGGQVIPPHLVDGGTSTTAVAQFTR